MGKFIGRVTTAAAVALCALAVLPGGASALQFEFVQQGTMTNAQVARVERAVSFQVDHQVARYWPGAVASFGPGGIPIYVTSESYANSVCGGPDALGCHTGGGVCSDNATVACNGPGEEWLPMWGSVAIYVGDIEWFGLTDAIDHEVIETVVDPDTIGYEVCDPVEGRWYYGVGGVALTDFVTPAWFQSPRRGRLDWLNEAGQ